MKLSKKIEYMCNEFGWFEPDFMGDEKFILEKRVGNIVLGIRLQEMMDHSCEELHILKQGQAIAYFSGVQYDKPRTRSIHFKDVVAEFNGSECHLVKNRFSPKKEMEALEFKEFLINEYDLSDIIL